MRTLLVENAAAAVVLLGAWGAMGHAPVELLGTLAVLLGFGCTSITGEVTDRIVDEGMPAAPAVRLFWRVFVLKEVAWSPTSPRRAPGARSLRSAASATGAPSAATAGGRVHGRPKVSRGCCRGDDVRPAARLRAVGRADLDRLRRGADPEGMPVRRVLRRDRAETRARRWGW